ncbi:methyltransferase domain-containing protein [Sphingomonas sp. SCN 67-18]|uniref:class I SAM-dependent methyltransferase n=1 Tax=uncultured Sphingomonas sp. TaxID=158754 RepID=UPI000A59D982|nr:methyltransferase domain-containing protein [Sphingomonas sp. SCN 67-18]
MMMVQDVDDPALLPGSELHVPRMPGHWLLAKLGKRVLRPGGLALTHGLIDGLAVTPHDDLVEFAPGLGLTAGLLLDRHPRSYVGVERDRDAAALVARRLPANARIVTGAAERSGLAAGSASVVIGEAMLTMNPDGHRRAIIAEAWRLLRPGGRYGIHELAIVPDDAPASVRADIESALSSSIHVGARPLTVCEWRALLEDAGFVTEAPTLVPMNLLNPGRLIADEGLGGALRFARNLLFDGKARQRVRAMRRVFQANRAYLRGIAIVARKP